MVAFVCCLMADWAFLVPFFFFFFFGFLVALVACWFWVLSAFGAGFGTWRRSSVGALVAFVVVLAAGAGTGAAAGAGLAAGAGVAAGFVVF